MLLFPPPGNFPDPEIKLTSPVSPALAGRFFTTAPPGNPGSYIVRGCLPLKIWKRDIRRCKLCIRTIFSFCDSQFQNIYIETEALWGFHQCHEATAAAAKSLQSCPTLCDPIDGSPPGSPIPRILQARTLEWVAISFSWKWKAKVKSLSHVQLCVTPETAAHQAPPSLGFFRQEHWSGLPFPQRVWPSAWP